MYRAVTLAALCRGVSTDDDGALSELADAMVIEAVWEDGAQGLLVDGEDVTGRLREATVERVVSRVSEVPGVRAALVRRQREMSAETPTVMVGRDIGTVVLPDAGLKVYPRGLGRGPGTAAPSGACGERGPATAGAGDRRSDEA